MNPAISAVSWASSAAPVVASSETPAATSTPAETTMPTKVQKVTRPPPTRSASLPPAIRETEPSSGPTKAIWAACRLAAPDWAAVGAAPPVSWAVKTMLSTWAKAKPKPMNEPKVPM